MKYLYFCFTLIFLIVSPFSYSFAETQTNIKNNIKIASPSTLLPGSPSKELTLVTVNTTGKIIGAIIAWFIALTAVLAVLAITWGSIQMVLAIGEDEKFKKARYTIIYAFIGLIVAGLAYAVVNFVTNLKLDNFL